MRAAVKIRLPKLELLLVLACLTMVLRFSQSGWSNYSSLITICVIVKTTAKILSLIVRRYENFNIFNRGNIPSVGDKNLFSGNIFQIIRPTDNIQVMLDYHKKLGKNYGFFYGQDPCILSTDLDLLYKSFRDEKNIDINQTRMPFVTEMNKSLAQVQGNQWRRIRRAMNPSFSHKQMKTDNVYKDIEDVCHKLIGCLDSYPLEETNDEMVTTGKSRTRIIDSLYNFKKFSLEVIFKVAYGHEDGSKMGPKEIDKFLDVMHEGSKHLWNIATYLSIMFDSARAFFGHITKFTTSDGSRQLHSMLDDCLTKRKQLLRENKTALQRRMIDTILEKATNDQIDQESLKANLFFMVLAGYETTANTIAIMFWFLARHPLVQEKLRLAIRAEGEDATYLDWVMRETLRLYPAVPAGRGRILSEDMKTSQGQTIYRGTTVLASIYSIHHSEEYWGPDVEVFRPERFGEPLAHPAQYFAFGFGPRNCIGLNLAKAEIRALVSRLLLRYRVESCATTPEVIEFIAPNLIHMIIDDPIDLRFIELESPSIGE